MATFEIACFPPIDIADRTASVRGWICVANTNPNPDPEKALTPRQLRRQQQREANAFRAASQPQQVLPLDVPLKPPSELLGPSVLVPVFCAMIVMGYLLFHAQGFAVKEGNELSQHQSVFTAVNAATLTGFQQARNPDSYNPAGRVLTFILMIAGMLFSFIGCGVGIIRIARMRFKDSQLVMWAFGSVFVVAIFGGLAMMTHDRPASAATFQAVSAFGNCGLVLEEKPDPNHARTLLVLLPLAVLGGLGLPVLMDICDSLMDRGPLSRHSRAVLGWSAGVYLASVLILLVIQWPGFKWPDFRTGASAWRSAFTQSSLLSLNARTAGLPFGEISRLPQAATFIVILLMLVGASPGGSGGGLKVTTLDVLTAGTLDTLAGRPPGRRFGVALVWILAYLIMLLVSTVALVISEPGMHLERTLFLAASALGNVGLSHDPVVVSTAGLYELSATMIVGRVAPMMMLWYVVDTTPDARVAVG
jgi:trk system potassium uptake protein TrkH